MDERSADAGDPARGPRFESGGRTRYSWLPWLAGLVLAGLAQQVLILTQAAAHNPFARTPMMDAEVYWTWAGRIAQGELIGERPFFSAPLYPYLLGLVRALGGGLGSVYALQLGLHLATAVLLAVSGRRRFDATAGLCAAAIWLLLSEPAYFTGRILNVSLQAFLVALLVERASAATPWRPARAAVLGLLVGLNCLAHPPFLVGLPLFAAWLAWRTPAGAGRVRAGLVCALVAVATVAPATLHNQRASGEWIPISAQAGITFYHGNQPGAAGLYVAAPGVSADRSQQNLDAVLRAREATGEEGFSAASRYYFGLGLTWWKQHPGDASLACLRKLWWFFTGRVYGDIHVPALEAEDGFATRLALAPLPAAWWLLPTLVGLVLLVRRRGLEFGPELLLFAIPLLVVCGFWYSPRYRAPALPIAALIGGWTVAVLVHWRDTPRLARALALALALGAVGGRVNAALDLDQPQHYRPQYELAIADLLLEEGRLDEAERHLRRAESLAASVEGAAGAALTARARLGEVLRRRGERDAAIQHLRALVGQNPNDAYVVRSLATALAESRLFEQAAPLFERTLELDPNDWQAESGLGNVLLELGRTEQAIGRYQRAIELDPSFFEARFNLSVALGRTGRARESIEALQGALSVRPDHEGALSFLAWTLATSGDEALRDGERSVVLAERLNRITNFARPDHLDVLAAAHAEAGAFDRAVEHAGTALRLYSAAGDDARAAEAQRRLALYRAGRAYRQG